MGEPTFTAGQYKEKLFKPYTADRVTAERGRLER